MSRSAVKTRTATALARAAAEALGLISRGAFAEAVAASQAILESYPEDLDALHILALAKRRLGETNGAVEVARRACKLHPNSAEAAANLGAYLRAQGDIDAARNSYLQAISIDRRFAPAHHNLGNLLRDEFSDPTAAEAAHTAALGAKPDYLEAWYGLGLDRLALGRAADALAAFETAHAIQPTRTDILVDIGNALMALERHSEARTAFVTALEADPANATALCNLGALYIRGGRLFEAERLTRRALEAAPQHHRMMSNLAGILKDLGRFEDAEVLFRQALAVKPDYTTGHSNLLFCLNYHPDRAAEEIFAEFQRWDERHARPLLPASVSFANSKQPQRRLRVGIMSPDLRQHSARHFLMPLFTNLDRDRVELFAYAEVAVPDQTTASFKALADHWCSTVGLSDDQVARRIREDGIDVLVDCGGHTAASRLLVLARKPAPVQVAYLIGHGSTSGMSAVDVFLADDALVPADAQHLFSETVVRLPRIPLAYSPPPDLPAVAPAPVLRNGFVTFGYFGRLERLNDRCLAVWARILKQVPSARLRLNAMPCGEAEYRDFLVRRFAAHDIGADRLQLDYTSPQPRTWDAYGEIDIALDPFPHNAGTTTIEALWLGVPVLSLTDRPPVGRFGAMILAAAGMTDWLATSADDYVERAVRFAADPHALARLRAGLRARMEASPLADQHGFAKAFETAIRHAWTSWCSAGATRKESEGPAQISEAISALTAGRNDLAITLTSAILAHNPDAAEALHVRAIARFRSGEPAAGKTDLEASIRMMPQRADWRWNAAALLRQAAQLEAALVHAQKAVDLAPDAPEAHNNLGSVLRDLGQLTGAEASFRRAIALNPAYKDALNNLAWLQSTRGQAHKAVATARQALAIRPNDAPALNNLGIALLQLDDLAGAKAAFEAASVSDPSFDIAHSNVLFCVNYEPTARVADIRARYQAWNDARAKPLYPKRRPAVRRPTAARRLHVGYVSADFRNHAVSYFVEKLIAAHDRSRFEIYCYSDVAAPDLVTERFKTLADQWRPIAGRSDEDVAAAIRNDCIDILIDLGGHTAGNRLLVFARRPAPLQFAHMVGSGTTTGLEVMDGYFTDALLVPPGEDASFSEPLIRLSRIPLCYSPPAGMPEVGALPAATRGHVTFGCFSRLLRVNPLVLDTWCELLTAVPEARLVLNTKPFQEDETVARWKATFQKRGIAPERVDLVYTSPQSATWAAYNTIDIALDPFPHNAGTTTVEALWMGVPVLSLADRPPVGRFGASILGAVGLDAWIADTRSAYVAKGATFARDIASLKELRATMRARVSASPLMDATSLARDMEMAMLRSWQSLVVQVS